MKQGLQLLLLAGFGVGVYFLLKRKTLKYGIGEYINYCGTTYLVINNQERDAHGNLLYQLQNIETLIAYWFPVVDVDANICVA